MTPQYSLAVVVPSMEIFNAYWYGYGVVTSIDTQDQVRDGWVTVTVDYGTDKARGTMQGERFASGLYWSTLLVS